MYIRLINKSIRFLPLGFLYCFQWITLCTVDNWTNKNMPFGKNIRNRKGVVFRQDNAYINCKLDTICCNYQIRLILLTVLHQIFICFALSNILYEKKYLIPMTAMAQSSEAKWSTHSWKNCCFIFNIFVLFNMAKK